MEETLKPPESDHATNAISILRHCLQHDEVKMTQCEEPIRRGFFICWIML